MLCATNLIWRAAGDPAMLGDIPGTCRACGINAQGTAFQNWCRDTFTDHDKLRPGAIVCHACQFCFTDQNEALGKLLGKDGPQRFRNYSHFVVRGEWFAMSKGAKSRMTELLMQAPEVAVIATSGQKHIAFRAVANRWQIEETTARPFPSQLSVLLETIKPLYDDGISKAEIESGRYSHKRILDFGLGAWRQAEAVISPLRGSMQLELALFLVQKSEEENDGIDGDSRKDIVADLEGDSRRIQGEVCEKHLGTVREQPTQRSLYE